MSIQVPLWRLQDYAPIKENMLCCYSIGWIIIFWVNGTHHRTFGNVTAASILLSRLSRKDCLTSALSILISRWRYIYAYCESHCNLTTCFVKFQHIHAAALCTTTTRTRKIIQNAEDAAVDWAVVEDITETDGSVKSVNEDGIVSEVEDGVARDGVVTKSRDWVDTWLRQGWVNCCLSRMVWSPTVWTQMLGTSLGELFYHVVSL